jgi:hypothetical protein
LLATNDSTNYAPEYSEAAFRNVQNGQTKSEVEGHLGDPLHILHGRSSPRDGAEQWLYADSPTGGSHAMRVVMFSEGGRVVNVYAGYDLD